MDFKHKVICPVYLPEGFKTSARRIAAPAEVSLHDAFSRLAAALELAGISDYTVAVNLVLDQFGNTLHIAGFDKRLDYIPAAKLIFHAPGGCAGKPEVLIATKYNSTRGNVNYLAEMVEYFARWETYNGGVYIKNGNLFFDDKTPAK